MRIGFFGGSFDPPHLGHLAVARAAATSFALDRVLFSPTGSQPLKPEGPTASFADRLAMVALLCELQAPPPGFVASNVDAPLADATPNYTVDTLTRLRAELLPEDALFTIVGADTFAGLPRWRSPDSLMDLSEWIVVSRPGFSGIDPGNFTPSQMQRVHLLDGVAEPASATDIRNRLRSAFDCADVLPANIVDYIRGHHLYGS